MEGEFQTLRTVIRESIFIYKHVNNAAADDMIDYVAAVQNKSRKSALTNSTQYHRCHE